MARYSDPTPQYLDIAGNPLALGSLYFYESNTAIDKITYADEAQTIPNANPLELSGGGYTPNCFFEGKAKAVLRTAEGVQVWERDPVTSGTYTIKDDPIFLKDHNSDGSHIVYESVADVRASSLTPFDGQKISLTGYYSKGDGGGQDIFWDATSIETDNGINVFKLTSITTGRYKSVNTDYITSAQGGAIADGSTDYTTRLNAVVALGGKMKIVPGSGNLLVSDNILITEDNTDIEFLGGVNIECTAALKFALYVTGDNVTLTKPKVTGPGTYVSSGTVASALIRVEGDYVTINDAKLYEHEQVGLELFSALYFNIDGVYVEGGPFFADAGEIGSNRQNFGIRLDEAKYGHLSNVVMVPNSSGGASIEGINSASAGIGLLEGTTIDNIFIEDSWDHGFYVTGEGNTISDLVVKGCGVKLQMRPETSADLGNTVSNINVDVGNRTGPLLGDTGLHLENWKYSSVSDVVIRNASDFGIHLNETSSLDKCTDNTFSNIVIDNVRRGSGGNAIGVKIGEVLEFSRNVFSNITITDIGEDTSGVNAGMWTDTLDNDNNILNSFSNILIETVTEDGALLKYLTDSSFNNFIIKDIGTSATNTGLVLTDLQRCEFDKIKGIGSDMDHVISETLSGYNTYRNITGYDISDSILDASNFAATNKIEGLSDGLGDVSLFSTSGNRTITASTMIQRTHLRDPNANPRVDTTDTAVNINDDILFFDGMTHEITYINTGEAAETITIAGGPGVTAISANGGGLVIDAGEGASLKYTRTSSTEVLLMVTVFD